MSKGCKGLKRLAAAQRRLYCLRLQRFSKFVQNYTEKDIYLFFLGRNGYNALIQMENFEVLLKDRMQITCMIWILMTRHKFVDAAKLMVYAIHSHNMAPSWMWRVVYQIFNSLRLSVSIFRFNRVLDNFYIADQHNRNMETILTLLADANWDGATKVVLEKPKLRAERKDLSREPERMHVEQLIKLYSGLAYFASWYLRSAGTDDRLPAEQLLARVENLITRGHICDIFLQPLIHIYHTNQRSEEALALLQKYAAYQPHNPNTDRYLAEWYLNEATGNSVLPQDSVYLREVLESMVHSAVPEVKQEEHNNFSRPISSLVLRHLVAFSLRLLPTPAPQNALSGSDNWHFVIADVCRRSGYFEQALEIVFRMLDHPSWCGFEEPWRLLEACIQELGPASPFVASLWAPRAQTWQRYILNHPNLSGSSMLAKNLLEQMLIEERDVKAPPPCDEDEPLDLGSILEVTPLRTDA